MGGGGGEGVVAVASTGVRAIMYYVSCVVAIELPLDAVVMLVWWWVLSLMCSSSCGLINSMVGRKY